MKNSIFLLAAIIYITTDAAAQGGADRRNRRTEDRQNGRTPVVGNYIHKTFAQENNLKGKVKSIREDDFLAEKQGNNIVKKPDDESRIKYYSSWHFLRTLSETGDEMGYTAFNKDGSKDYSREFVYAKPGMVSQWVNYDGNHTLKSKVVFEYDGRGYLTKSNSIDKKGAITHIEKYAYTFHSGNTYKKHFFDSTGKMSADVITYKLNADTLVAELNSASSHIFLNYYTLYTYDSLKNLVGKVTYSSKAKKGEDPQYAGFEKSVIEKNTYDKYGNIIKKEQEFFSEFGNSFKTETYTYTYDKMGNWVKRVKETYNSIFKSRDYEISEREIKYY